MITKRKLYYSLTPSLRYLIRRVYFLPIDLWNSINGKRDRMIPPQGLIFIGTGDFKKIGEHYLAVFIEHCGLLPEHHVLDIGCGIGRIAIPLTNFLNNQGSYDGFDVVEKGISWCRKHISTSFPNFRFQHVALKNDLYNLKTEQRSKDFIFPYPDNNFDLIIVTSVFTHMLIEDVEKYFKEIYRVLKPQGKCLATFFILNAESRNYMKSNHDFNFDINLGNYSLLNHNVKEANVAYEENYILYLITQNNLFIERTFNGFWSGRPKEESFDFQDTLIISKR